MTRSPFSVSRRPQALVAIMAATAVWLTATCTPARAATAAPGWTISSAAEPANFSAADNAACEAQPTFLPGQGGGSVPCDSYRIVARNVGSAPSSEPITITDALPEGVQPVFAALQEQQAGAHTENAECTLAPIRCEYPQPVAPGGEVIVTVNVTVLPSAKSPVMNSASIEGGGLTNPLTSTEPTTEPNTVNGAAPPFDTRAFQLLVRGADGAPDSQAGDHPYTVTTSLRVPSTTRFDPSESRHHHVAVQRIKSLIVDLPPGFLGNPQATPRCPLTALQENYVNETSTTNCPVASRVGTIVFELEGVFRTSNGSGLASSSIFNMVPEDGYPAEFGFSFLGQPVLMYANALPSASGYRLRVSVPALVRDPLEAVSLTFFGDPARQDGGVTAPSAFLTNPVDCAAAPLTARLEADSWEEPARWVSHESSTYPQLDGCNMLQFQPSIQVSPEVSRVDTPSGYEVDVKVPQGPNVWPALATPELRGATVTLPQGVSVSPGAADGLLACKERGPEGIELGDKNTLGHDVQEGEEPGPGGLPRAARGHCPAASQIGTVQIETPLLPPHTLTGHVYLAEPRCGGEGQPPCTEASARNGELFGLYLEAEGEGAVIKLKGTVSADPSTGQLTARFNENPQLPFSDLKVRFDGGPRAPLANPQTCGQASTTSVLSPWSSPETPDATPSWTFAATGCGATTPFAPSLRAGTVVPIAGGFSPFSLTFSRQDAEQNLGGITVQTPPGLLGKISEVPLCGEPQAREGRCAAASRIGTTSVAVGAGSHPFWLSGRVYLTGPYKGAPFGLSIVVPAKAGPFNLGDEVVRAAINVDRRTSALTVTSDQLPQHKDGVPFRLKTVNVTIDRPNFMFNPTNCSQQAITAMISGVLPESSRGTSVPVSTPFAAAGCKNLPFKPKFTVLTQAHTSKANGASLHVKVTSGPGQANIEKVKVYLPKQLPSRLTTLQKACPDSTFNANPASCRADSVVGTATAVTPVLKSPLTGPAYLVSHAAAAFPDLVIVLQGEGITLDLVGNTDIKKGITISTFSTLPDAPISTFDLVLSQGPHSVLGANLPARAKGSLCRRTLAMPTLIAGQNGAVIRQTTRVSASGCARHKTRKAGSNKRGKKRGTVKARKR
jgi:hypothetical protein